ncbi:MAG TPA: hypothetical protein VI011_25765 [Asanoa sp.]
MLAIVVALVAAFLYAASNSMQQHSVQIADTRPPPRSRKLSRVLPVTRLLPQLARSRLCGPEPLRVWAGR